MLTWWVAGSLQKVFQDDGPGGDAGKEIRLAAAGNEKEDAQICLRSDRKVARVAVQCTELTGPGGARIPAESVSARFVGYAPVHENTADNGDGQHIIRRAPAFFPDPFLEWPETKLHAGQTQPIWVTVAVPGEAPAGEYRGTVTVHSDEEKIEVSLTLHVWPFSIPRKPSVWHTEWFFPGNVEDWYGLERFSDDWWRWMEIVARDMGQHRQNVILTPLQTLVHSTATAGGYAYDYSNLDRWVELFDRYGVADRVEGSHLGGRCGDWESEFVFSPMTVHDAHGVPTQLDRAPVDDPDRRALLSHFLQSLRDHLVHKGWWSRFILHQADEPIPPNEASYRVMSAFVRETLPDVPRIDAVMSEGLEGCIEIRVPQIQELREGMPAAGEELWSYTCLAPQGPYPNRFLDYASLKTRTIHWLNWRYNATGYLHWGYGAWRPWGGMKGRIDPWNSTTGSSEWLPLGKLRLPPGDTHVAYPGQEGICDSIRWEMVRKGMEDHEYLLLVEKGIQRAGAGSAEGAAATALLDRVRRDLLKSHSEYTRSEAELLDARRKLAEAIIALGSTGDGNGG